MPDIQLKKFAVTPKTYKIFYMQNLKNGWKTFILQSWLYAGHT